MKTFFTITQRQRLKELNALPELLERSFSDEAFRDACFRETEEDLKKKHKRELKEFLGQKRRPLLCEMETRLIQWLTQEEGFTQVVTPIIIPEAMLTKMTITEDHPLRNQVFRIEDKKYLRPMLAPNLYELMRDIHKVTREPVKIFEVGPCFRKETLGAQHLNEFTMLNLVEFSGVEEGKQMERLRALAEGAMAAIGLSDYQLETTESEVYGETLDVVYEDMELGSGAYGPHFLDSRWGIFDKTWVGIGFGMERIAMAAGGFKGIKKIGRNLSYLNGIRLNV